LFIAFSLFDRCVSDALADEKLEKVYDFGSQCSIDLFCSIPALCQRKQIELVPRVMLVHDHLRLSDSLRTMMMTDEHQSGGRAPEVRQSTVAGLPATAGLPPRAQSSKPVVESDNYLERRLRSVTGEHRCDSGQQ